MSGLVYLSPVAWADFAQRPHKFAEWHHARHGGRVLWVEPYPSRLPRIGDLQRIRRGAGPPGQAVPPWLELLPVPALPIEPLPGGTLVNGVLWRPVLERIAAFARQHRCELVIGKPTQLALRTLAAVRFTRTAYDAMDDFPAFHGGLSAHAMAAAERRIAREADLVYASSNLLRTKFAALGAQVRLVRNACDPASLPPAGARDPGVVGYVGTLASWFDWELVIALAEARPALRFVLIGPVHGAVPADLPANIRLLPACAHPEAMRHMAGFGVGLIPFRRNKLTDAVDPVKYYEYRALGVPVLSTPFGEMTEHAREDRGVVLVTGAGDAASALDEALACASQPQELDAFRAANSWAARFA